MTEADINKMPINELFDLLMKSNQELIYFNCEQDRVEYDEKKIEVQLIQRIIVAKRAEFPPLV
jgi:hypothetical protein